MNLAWFLFALFAFDAMSVRQALDHDSSREGTLRLILTLNAIELKEARRAPLGFPLVRLVENQSLPVRERIMAARAIARLNARQVSDRLGPLLGRVETPESTAVAREVAQTLYQLGARQTLRAGLGSRDPEVRRFAAQSGAGGLALCALLRDDPWPMVRTAAAQGLGLEPRASSCLQAGLKDPAPKVRAACVEALSELGNAASIEQFRAFALNANEDRRVRRAAIMALGQLGHVRTASDLISTHLKHGELAPLAQVAVISLAHSKVPDTVFLQALHSTAPTVILAAARILHRRDQQRYASTIREARRRLRGRLREQLDLMMTPPVHAQSLGQDIVTDAPEDP
ncbi:MAG: HEAT repeat domain-containing protein [Myxococcota bacterium]|nr:HEAT repeat domain-containing protein [Myxococcota bacterium]